MIGLFEFPRFDPIFRNIHLLGNIYETSWGRAVQAQVKLGYQARLGELTKLSKQFW